MGQVILSLEEYEDLRKKADATAELSKCFVLEKTYSGKGVALSIPVNKAAEIFKTMFTGSKYDDGTLEVYEDIRDYNVMVAEYYIKAVKKQDEPKEELTLGLKYEDEEEVKEDTTEEGGPF